MTSPRASPRPNAPGLTKAKSLLRSSLQVRTFPSPQRGTTHGFDQRAKHVIDACRLADISVPEQIQVLGVDNEAFICEQTTPSLSSIQPDFEDLGYRAASALDRLLVSSRPKTVRIVGKVTGGVERFSTTNYLGGACCVALAREFIRRNASTNITVGDVVRAAHTSQRLLQMHFQKICGKSVRDELIDTHLRLVKESLRSTCIPIDRIGDFCGFRGVKYLKTLFKRRFGVTMSEYRQSTES